MGSKARVGLALGKNLKLLLVSGERVGDFAGSAGADWFAAIPPTTDYRTPQNFDYWCPL